MAGKTRLCVETFREIVRKLGIDRERIAVAVSGGRDSMGLAVLAQKTMKNVVAMTVDHKLRPASEVEVTFVETVMSRMQVEHCLLKCSWPHGVPNNKNLQQKAREQRYKLLAFECARQGIKHLFLAHHLNDQIETFIQRLGRSSGIDGLSSMKMVTQWQSNLPLLLIRPLLSFTRDDLTNFCQGNGIPWLDDPSNENREFLRVAIRSSLTSAFSINKLTIQDLSLLMEMFTDANRRANCEVFNVITDQVHVKSAFGYAEVDITSISSLPVTTLNRLLTQLVKFSSGFPYPPSLKSIHKLLTSPIRGRPTQLVTQAIGGCLAFPLKRKHGNTSTLVVCRQPPERGVERREKVTVGSPLWWDGRFMIFGRYNCSNHGPVSQQQLLPTGCDQFYVRCMRKADFELLKWDESAQKAL
jgi:tRNA(Ile)-lysidine synthase